MGSICARLNEKGFSPGPASLFHSGSLDRGGALKFDVHLVQESQLIVVALASDPAENLDLTVWDSTGHNVAQDTTPDRRAVISWMSSPQEIYTVQLNASEGRGRFLIRGFLAPQSTPPLQLNGFFDADPGYRREWKQVENRVALMGFETSVAPKRFPAARGERQLTPQKLTTDVCYLFVAQGSPGIDSLELRLERKRQGLVVADLSRRPEGWMRYCAEQNEELRLAIIVHAGSGSVTWNSFTATRDRVRSLVGPPLHLEHYQPTQKEVQTYLERELEMRGHSHGEKIAEGRLSPGDRIRGELRLKRHQCSLVYTISQPDLQTYDVQLFREDRSIEAHYFRIKGHDFYGVCATEATDYQVELVALFGKGTVSLMKADLPIQPVWHQSDDMTIMYLANAVSTYWSSMGMEELKETPVNDFTESSAADERRMVFDRERCYGVSAVSNQPLAKIIIKTPKGKEMARWVGPHRRGDLALCPQESGEYTVEITPHDAERPGRIVRLLAFATAPARSYFRDSRF